MLLGLFLAAAVLHATSAVATATGEGESQLSSVQETNEPIDVPKPSRRAVQFHRSGMWIWGIDRLLAIFIPAVALFSGLSLRLRQGVERLVGRRWLPQLFLFFIVWVLAIYVLYLPWRWYTGYVRLHAYDIATYDITRWWILSLKRLGVDLVTGLVVVGIPYALMRAAPRYWWAWCAVVSVPFAAISMLVFPIWIDPLFSDFQRLSDTRLESRILELAEAAGVEEDRVYEVIKSRDVKAVNAYVAGLGSTKRIVLYDTLLQKADDDQVAFVMAHEIGHYVLGHAWKGLMLSSVLVFAGLFLIDRFCRWFLRRYRSRVGFGRLRDPASLPLLLMALQLASLLLSPFALAQSRAMEREADVFALELTRDNRAAASTFVALQRHNLSHPRPNGFYMLVRASHPSLSERIHFANAYRPWEDGQRLRFPELQPPERNTRSTVPD